MSNDKNTVLGRLAARDAASLRDAGIEATADDDKIAAFSRIIEVLGVPILQAKHVYKKLIEHLQASDLTINFMAYKFFNHAPEGSGYVSQFEGGNKWGGDSYITARNQAEEGLFDFADTEGKGTSTASAAAVDRVQKLAVYTSAEFSPASRPKYAALNYARLAYGSAGQWGKSHVVLKEHVKHGATYIHSDSFDMSGSARDRAKMKNQVANYFNMQRLLVNMPVAMMTALHKVAVQNDSYGPITQVPGLGDTAYIEGHCHGALEFNRDIAALVLNEGEIADTEAKTALLHQQDPKRWKKISAKKLRQTFTKFATANSIPIRYTT